MAWTAPRTWATNEIVTASMMNTHVRDNLKYLKGQAGTIAFEAAATFAGIVQATDAGSNHQLTLIGAGANNLYVGNHVTQNFTSIGVNRNPSTGTFDNSGKSHAEIRLNGDGTTSFVTIATAAAANTAGTERVRVDGSGRMGIGRTTPQGLLHGYDAISGFLKFEYDGLDGTQRTVIPDGAGDVLYGMTGWSIVRSSGGNVNTGVNAIINGGTTLLVNNNYSIFANGGTDVVQLQIASNGAVTVQRTAGSLTYKVGLLLIWA